MTSRRCSHPDHCSCASRGEECEEGHEVHLPPA
jgi:hypothetical protein